MKEIKKFGTWLDENKFDNKFTLTEAKKTAPKAENPKIANTVASASKNAEYFKKLDQAIGISGKIPNEHEALEILKKGEAEFIPAYWNESKGQISIPNAHIDTALDQFLKAGFDCESASGSLRVTFEDGKYIDLHVTGKDITLASGKGDGTTAASQFLVPETPAQESMTAAILQAKAENAKIDGQLPRCVIEFLGEKKAKKLNAFARWLLSSNPALNTGLCKYIDFQVPEDKIEEFQVELANFMFSGNQPWFNSFNKLYESQILQEIASVFKNGVQNWKAAKFCHFWNKIGGKTYRGSWVEDYLSVGRAGSPSKDTVDKSDIFLCFNLPVASRIAQDLLKTKTKEEYIQKMNGYINEKSFIGISLKKISGQVNLSAVNFKTATTAVGDNINDDKKICFKFLKPGDKGNTFALVNARLKPPEKATAVSCEIRVPFTNGHSHDVHMPDDAELIVAVRSNSSRFGSITVEGRFVRTQAQLGKMGDPLMKYFKYSPADELKKLVTPKDSPEKICKAYIKVANDILHLFQSNEEAFYRILADGVGYPLQIGKNKNNVIINSAPYIKIY